MGPVGTSVFYPDFETVYEKMKPEAQTYTCGNQEMADFLVLALNEMQGDQESTTYWFAQMQAALAAAYDSGVAGGSEAWARALFHLEYIRTTKTIRYGP
ncbi:hypothetical protein MNBD_NITROSPIRAE01-231 [hydrothermal vent metagenome]|uniref:Uncharacterized protein n=1 Tax=hydrothermal vent metagenome TaxID=652676 RepID=A0A3B1CLZ9_9ZZZZ